MRVLGLRPSAALYCSKPTKAFENWKPDERRFMEKPPLARVSRTDDRQVSLFWEAWRSRVTSR
jgi:hypothetical protein